VRRKALEGKINHACIFYIYGMRGEGKKELLANAASAMKQHMLKLSEGSIQHARISSCGSMAWHA